MAPLLGLISLGCNKNRVDSEIALGLMKDHRYCFTADPAEADVLMVNTCGFIEAAKEESIDTILELAEYKKTGRCKVLVVTGCLAQRYENELLAEIPEIDVLLGVNQYALLPDAVQKALKGQSSHSCKDDYTFIEHNRVLTTPPYTAYTRIGDGCSNRCTFCAIPLIRGPYRSRDEKLILQEIKELAGQGVREHILVAQDTTRFGTDDGSHTALPALMKKAASIEGVDWLRVLYCYPDETNEELLDVLANTPNVCRYLDLPIQHIDPVLLRRMHRRGTDEDIIRCVKMAQERKLTLRTSIIVGFPGETEDQFKKLLDFVSFAQFDRLGAFTYSPEEGTPAARMEDQIPEEIKQERLDRLMNLQATISLKKNQARVGQVVQVLVTDHNDEGLCLGRSESEAPETDGEIVFKAADQLPEAGEFVNVRITQADTYDLMGEQIK